MNLALAVVIPARNEALVLQQTLPALQRALGALEFPCRIFLVDDGSEDDTAAIAQSYGVDVVAGTAEGPGAARNRGAKHALSWFAAQDAAEGWFLFLDADCQLDEEHPRIIQAMLRDTTVSMISVQERPRLPHGIQRIGSRFKRAGQRWLANRCAIPIVHAGCLYIRASEFVSLGGFNHEHLFEDVELGLRHDPERIRILSEPSVIEVSDRRLHRVGTLSSLVTPARSAATMFITHQIAHSWLAAGLLAAFLRTGPDRLPATLWWSDPERRLHVGIGSALMVVLLWVSMLAALRIGLIERQSHRRALPILENRQAG